MLQQIRMQNETYQYNSLVKKDGVVQEWTQEEVHEYAKCMASPSYFAETYVKIISLDKGLVPFDLYPYQEKMFNHFNDNRFSIVLACRQSGKSISSVGYLLWYAIFHPEKTIAVLANKGSTSREMLGRGMSVNLLYLDEFAFVERAGEFYTSTYPVISSGIDTKVIITSTANGIGNIFHNIWQGAEQGTNDFKSFRVDWWDVPNRDEKWKEQTIANTSQLQFDQEFGNTFFGTGNTLINAETLLSLRSKPPLHIREGGQLLIYEETLQSHEYIMTVDVSKGRGQDYSTFTVIDISTRPFKQVAVYRNNLISPILFPNIIYKYASVYNNAYVVVENNDQGAVVCNGLYYDIEYENVHVSSAIKSSQIGVEINRRTKRIGCSGIKDLLEEKKLEIVDEETIMEISTFILKGQSYEASEGNHDDLMMNLVMFGFFVGTEMFYNMSDIDLKSMLFEQRMIDIEADVVPFGVIDDGSAYIEEIMTREEIQAKEWGVWQPVDTSDHW